MKANASTLYIEPVCGQDPAPTPVGAGLELHLVPAGQAAALAGAADGGSHASALVLPQGPSRIWVPGAAAARAPLTAPAAGVIEPYFTAGRQASALLVQTGAPAPRVNGEPVPVVTSLRPFDLLAWGEAECEVALYLRPVLGPPPPEAVGQRACPVCRVPFTAQDWCYHCACGAIMHMPTGKPGSLDCALVRAPAGCICQREIILEARYARPGGGQ